MLVRSKHKKKNAKKTVTATIKVVEPENTEEKELLDLSTAKITIIKPEPGLTVAVKEEED